MEKTLCFSKNLFRHLQMVFWKPFAVPGCAGFAQPYEKARVPVTGVTVYSWTMLLIIREGPRCWLQRMETIVPKVVTWHLLLKTHTHIHITKPITKACQLTQMPAQLSTSLVLPLTRSESMRCPSSLVFPPHVDPRHCTV